MWKDLKFPLIEAMVWGILLLFLVWGFLCTLFFGCLVSLSEIKNQNKTDFKGQLE